MSAEARLGIAERLGKDRGFLADRPLRNATVGGVAGIALSVRLTSYRSLPLSCIQAIQLSIDGRSCDPAELRLALNYATHSVAELAGLSHVWWFILDYAELFAPLVVPLAAGPHEIEGTLVTVEPYMTAGRFAFHNYARRSLLLEAALPGRGT